jgi:hypothetical protein
LIATWLGAPALTSKTRHKKTKKRPRPALQSTAKPTGTFRMVAAANPSGPSLTVGPELDLVKAALLYGDKVTLISPTTTMLLRTEGLQRFSNQQLVELIRRVAPVLTPPDELPEFERGLEQIDRLFKPALRGGLNELLLKQALHQVLGPGKQMLSENLQGIATRAGIDQLARARREGLGCH